MWIVYKTKPGDTMDTIIARQKIKDPALVLTHKDNKKIYKDLKAGKALPKNTKVTIPDPKGKIYVVKTPSGVKHMTEAVYKDYLKGVHEKMDEAVFKLKQTLSYAQGRHDAQNKINDDQWFVAACIDLVNSVPEPKSRKKAESTFSAAEKAAKSRNYKGFEKAIEPANIAIAIYKNEVIRWIDGIINAGESTIDKLEGVKKVGMVCGAVAATTVIAPAGLIAGVATGVVTGGGTQLAYDGFDAIGRVAAGMKPRSTADTLKRAAGGALVGGIGAGVVGILMKGVTPILGKLLTGNKFLEAQVKRIIFSSSSSTLKNIYAQEVKAVVGKLGISSTDALMAARPVIMGEAVMKLLLRLTAGFFNKWFESGKKLEKAIFDWGSADAKRLAGKSPDKTAAAFVSDLVKGGLIDQGFDDLVKNNINVYTKLLRDELRKAAAKQLKNERA